ncbi:gamma-tubulin complex, DGRIP91/SPC98 component protein [Collybia nuda]|uniref:Spindle pole body component n=1 Tax=Collybia nuda TaxID=64659 RepID=A0A9P6CIC4_9AGAR|nr:gamma-tubulin complex, DGRIP91/SPC98 component protein [Collybia nuda]
MNNSYDYNDFDALSLDPPLGPGKDSKQLPRIEKRFFVPRLVDKPQNPIMDALKLASVRSYTPPPIPALPAELASIVSTPFQGPSPLPKLGSNVWYDAMMHNPGVRSKVLSWDRLRSGHQIAASSTGFLSEQESLVFAAARHHVQARLNDPTKTMVYVTQAELLNALKMTVLGASSIFHVWDASEERFVQSGVEKGNQGFLLMDGKDEVVSQSLISRFLTIGTLLRRLEVLLATLRARSAREGPTVHAYAHTLSTTISYLRDGLARCPPLDDQPTAGQLTLSAIWIQYGIYEELLIALSTLYHREYSKLPKDYPKFDSAPVPLLSYIYDHLNMHFERQSPKIVIAIFAYILTNTSHEYFQHVSQSIGYGLDPVKKVSRVIGEKPDQYSLEEEEQEKGDDLFETIEHLEDKFPDFFPPELLDILPAAQKSLVLLQAAQPDHPILKRTVSQEVVGWFWKKSEIEAAWACDTFNISERRQEPPQSDTTKEKQAFSLFKLFDLDPGSNFGTATPMGKENTSFQSLQFFIDSFPESLPPITPTLSHLTSLVFAQLVQHASRLSSALLNLFLSSTDTLNFQAHLELLRSYLLLTAPPFKSRLAAALFSDSDDSDQTNKGHSMSIRSLRRKPNKKSSESHSQLPWAVGLASALLERETWPPVGADLSFFLRTVIVDSFEFGKDHLEENSGRRRVQEEAEYRLGFAIRDLPVDPGRDKWLNPLSIEALDFLYMDYKPPHPLEVLITPEVLSKYQRMFAFIIRLMRVESALNALFRMTRPTSKPLFPTLAPSNKLLLHFRFTAHSFVSALSGYVFDTTIRGNFDLFISQLSSSDAPPVFTDVFALAKKHSTLLDDILSACLLRSGQRAVGDLLRQSLELILEFINVVGELFRGRIEEYQAALMIDGASQKFYTKMVTLTKVLKGLVDKNVSAAKIPLQGSLPGGDLIRRPVGGADALYHLLMRLDLGSWWSMVKP